MKGPNVTTDWYDSDLNFIFRARAYRKLSTLELRHALHHWMHEEGIDTPPKNKLVEFMTTYGYDD